MELSQKLIAEVLLKGQDFIHWRRLLHAFYIHKEVIPAPWMKSNLVFFSTVQDCVHKRVHVSCLFIGGRAKGQIWLGKKCCLGLT